MTPDQYQQNRFLLDEKDQSGGTIDDSGQGRHVVDPKDPGLGPTRNDPQNNITSRSDEMGGGAPVKSKIAVFDGDFKIGGRQNTAGGDAIGGKQFSREDATFDLNS